MDVRLSPEQMALRDAAARLVGDLGPATVADLDDAERVAKLDAAVGAAGWREIRVGDEAGRPLAAGVEAAVVAEELGRGLADTAYLGPLLAHDLARRAGADLPGECTVALRSDLSGLADLTTPDPAVGIDCAGSRSALTVTRDGDGLNLTIGRLGDATARVDLTRTVASLERGSADSVVGRLAREELASWSALAVALTCADLVGVMRGAVALARDYALVREQYGRLIGSFQAVQHLLADAHVASEGAYSVALHAAWAADALPPEDALTAARIAKAYCGRAARMVCESSIQVHGGIGNTWECLAHVHLRRALHSTDLFGDVGSSLAYLVEQQRSDDLEGTLDGLR